MDQMENSLFDIPDYDQIDDERFAAFPPPLSPGGVEDGGQPDNGMEDGDENRGSPKEEEPPKPTRKTVKRNIPKLNADRLISERGLPALRTLFADTKFKGKGHEVEDLKLLLRRMEHWAHRLYPKLGFEDFISKLEVLGNKKPVQTCLKRIRMDMPIVDDDFTAEGGNDEAVLEGQSNSVTMPSNDDFDMHLPSADPDPFSQIVDTYASSPPPSQSNPFLSEETRLRIERNKQLALERRLAKIQSSSQAQDLPSTSATLLVEDKVKKVQELEEFGEDMDAEFLDALVAAEMEVPVKDDFGNAATLEVDNNSTALASSYVCQVASFDNFVADSPSKEGSETAVVREAPKSNAVDIALEVVKKAEEPIVPTVVPGPDVDLVTASRSTELAEECAENTYAFQDNLSMKNVEKSPDTGSSGPETSATGVTLGTPVDDPSPMEPSVEMLVSGVSMNQTVLEGPDLSVEVTETAVKATAE